MWAGFGEVMGAFLGNLVRGFAIGLGVILALKVFGLV